MLNKIKKTSLIILAVIVISLTAINNFTNINFIKGYISEFVYELLGRQINLNGDIKLKLIPNLGFVANNIQLLNADWAEEKYFIESKYLEINLSLTPLLYGEIEITKIELDGMRISLERNSENKENWNFNGLKEKMKKKDSPDKDSSDKEEQESNNIKTIEHVKIENYLPFDPKLKITLKNIEINYKDKNIEQYFSIKELALEKNKNIRMKLLADYGDIPISLNFRTPSLKEIFDRQSIPLEADGKIGNIDLDIKTNILFDNKEQKYEVLLDTRFDDFSIIEKLTKTEFPEVGKVLFKTKIIKNNKSIKIIIDKGEIDGLLLEGEVEYIAQNPKSESKPKIISKLNIKSLNIKKINTTLSESSKNKKEEIEDLFSKEKIPYDYLLKYDADLDINIEGIENNILELNNIAFKLKLDDGSLKINKLFIENNAGEKLNANISINANSKPPKLSVSGYVENIKLEKYNNLKKHLSGAVTNVKLDLDSKGISVHEIMNNLNGMVVIKVGKGKLKRNLITFLSSDFITKLVNSINPLSNENKNETTNLVCAAVRLDINKGLVVSDRGIVMKTDEIQIISSGIIDLKEEILEFGIKIEKRKGVELNFNRFASAAKLSGKIIDPKIKVNLTETAIAYSNVATGGMTFLFRSLYNAAIRDDAPCETAVLSPKQKK